MSTNKSRVLTLDTVLAEEPCGFYRRQFTDRFPVSVEVTTDLAKSQAAEWDWFWAAEMLLSYEGFQMWLEIYRKAMNARDEAVANWSAGAAAREAYDKADEAYNRVHEEVYAATNDWDAAYNEAYDASRKISRVADAVLIAVRKVTREIYNETIAVKWAEIYIAEGENNDAS